VYGFVKQSNGHIVLDSELGRGTKVMLFLPRAAAVAAAAAPPERRQPEMRGAQEIVLVVEDDKLVRSYVLTQI
ncbi:MAG TPA: hybrid sensor histidine kinase/response regulator, partial [Bradyrhizobium sp.]|nr:hybrid sensor histidine kinase/response regulator [Bradyrhizobium sp.]